MSKELNKDAPMHNTTTLPYNLKGILLTACTNDLAEKCSKPCCTSSEETLHCAGESNKCEECRAREKAIRRKLLEGVFDMFRPAPEDPPCECDKAATDSEETKQEAKDDAVEDQENNKLYKKISSVSGFPEEVCKEICEAHAKVVEFRRLTMLKQITEGVESMHMTFTKALEKMDAGISVRLSSWSPDVRISKYVPDKDSEFTLPFYVVDSRFGRLPWKETYAEMASTKWEVYTPTVEAAPVEEVAKPEMRKYYYTFALDSKDALLKLVDKAIQSLDTCAIDNLLVRTNIHEQDSNKNVNFARALYALRCGKPVRRAAWSAETCLVMSDGQLHIKEASGKTTIVSMLKSSHVIASDWIIID